MVKSYSIDRRSRIQPKRPPVYCGRCGCRLTEGESHTFEVCDVCNGYRTRVERADRISKGKEKLWRPYKDPAPAPFTVTNMPALSGISHGVSVSHLGPVQPKRNGFWNALTNLMRKSKQYFKRGRS